MKLLGNFIAIAGPQLFTHTAAFTHPKINIMTGALASATMPFQEELVVEISDLREPKKMEDIPIVNDSIPKLKCLLPNALEAPKTISHSQKSLEVEVSGLDGPEPGRVILHSMIPDGFAIVDHEVFEGKKIIATRRFKKGDLMYTGSAALLDLIGHGYKLKIYSEDHNANRCLLSTHDNSDTHSVDDYAVGSKSGIANKRQVYGWDSFMNHSCDPNAYFPLLYRSESEMYYRAIALRDIDAGTEVTCDYALFDYDCNGHGIENCACGSNKCRGKMLGFQGQSLYAKMGAHLSFSYSIDYLQHFFMPLRFHHSLGPSRKGEYSSHGRRRN